jgi:hypothetical protein
MRHILQSLAGYLLRVYTQCCGMCHPDWYWSIGTESTGALYFGCLLLGIPNGFLATFSNIYTSEASPAQLRGVFVPLFAY